MHEMVGIGDERRILRQQVQLLQEEVAVLVSENTYMRGLLCLIIQDEFGGRWKITKAQKERMELIGLVIVKQDNLIDYSTEFTVVGGSSRPASRKD